MSWEYPQKNFSPVSDAHRNESGRPICSGTVHLRMHLYLEGPPACWVHTQACTHTCVRKHTHTRTSPCEQAFHFKQQEACIAIGSSNHKPLVFKAPASLPVTKTWQDRKISKWQSCDLSMYNIRLKPHTPFQRQIWSLPGNSQWYPNSLGTRNITACEGHYSYPYLQGHLQVAGTCPLLDEVSCSPGQS